MPKSEQLNVTGILEWARVFESNRDRAEWTEETDGAYKVTVLMDKDMADKLKAAGCRKKITEENGKFRVTFGRPHKAKFDWQGGAPFVADVAGKPWNMETMGLIGNGSEGIVKIDLYDGGPLGKGTRLLGVQVVNHVVYESEGGSSHPSSMFTDLSGESAGTTSPPPSSPSVPEDSIPF